MKRYGIRYIYLILLFCFTILKETARKTVLVAWQERKRDTLQHSFTGETAPIGLFPFLQAQLLARHLRGDLDGYPPFIWK